jgi:hypothetical protein
MCAPQRPAQAIVVEHAATKLLVDETIMVRFIYMGSGSVTATAIGPTVCHWSVNSWVVAYDRSIAVSISSTSSERILARVSSRVVAALGSYRGWSQMPLRESLCCSSVWWAPPAAGASVQTCLKSPVRLFPPMFSHTKNRVGRVYAAY